MNNKRLIIAGLIIFIAAATFPIWYTAMAGGSGPRPLPEPPKGESRCIEDKAYMTGNHMQLLIDWRDTVVRNNERFYTSRAYNKQYEISLTKTCLKCHASREKFCNRCHDYAEVYPNCWNCHVEPKGK